MMSLLWLVSVSFLTRMTISEAIGQCEEDLSIGSMALNGHTFKTLAAPAGPTDCFLHCEEEVRCQSYNYVINNKMCELNDRTKEAAPEDFVPDRNRFYKKRSTNRVPLGSISKLLAKSCKEIKANEGGEAVSGNYWLDCMGTGEAILVRCNMETEGPGYKATACFEDRAVRAIETLEGQDAILDGDYHTRVNAIHKCYQAAKKRGFKVFAVQDGGWCAASATAACTYSKYGASSNCSEDGKGGPWANQVYFITVPDPIALYPLNSKSGTREIFGRASDGVPHGVQLAPGPDGTINGSYEFAGNANSYIEFPNNGQLDTQHSMTMLCWVNPGGQDGPLFNYKPSGAWGVHFWILYGKLFVRFTNRDYSLTDGLTSTVLTPGQWKFVGASYDRETGDAKLWIDGAFVQTLNIGVNLLLGTQDDVRMGVRTDDGRDFKGKIARMQVYNMTLTQKQIQIIQGEV